MDTNQKLQFKDFCESTSLHGWGFMALGKFKPLQMVFWSFTVLFAFCLCAFYISQSTEEYMNGVEFKTETLTESLDEVYFPAVYVSSNTLVRLSPLLEIVLGDNGDSNETARNDATKMLRNVLLKQKGDENKQQQIIKKILSPGKMKQVFWDFVHENQQKWWDRNYTTITVYNICQQRNLIKILKNYTLGITQADSGMLLEALN